MKRALASGDGVLERRRPVLGDRGVDLFVQPTEAELPRAEGWTYETVRELLASVRGKPGGNARASVKRKAKRMQI